MSLRALLLAAALVLAAGHAFADEAPDPLPEEPARPSAAEPSRAPEPEPPRSAACGLGAGLAVFGIGVFGAWRLSKTQRKAQTA